MYNGVLEVTNQRFLLVGSPYNKGKRKRLYCDKSNVMSESAHTCALECVPALRERMRDAEEG